MSSPSSSDFSITPTKIQLTNNKATFTIKSHTYEGLAFKIKTTRPNLYNVDPPIGIILPNQDVKIQVNLLQNVNEFGEHKFKVMIYFFDSRLSLEDFKEFSNDRSVKCLEQKMDVVSFKEGKEIELGDVFGIGVVCIVFLSLVSGMIK